MDSTQKNFFVDKPGHIEKFGNITLCSPSSQLGDDAFSRSYGMSQTSDSGFIDEPDYEWTYGMECGGMHQNGSHSQRSTVQGIEEVLAPMLDEKLSYEDGQCHGVFAHPQENMWPLDEFHVYNELPPPPYKEAPNNDFLTAGPTPPVGQTSTTGTLPLPYDVCTSTNASHYGHAKFLSEPNLKRNPGSVLMNQKILNSQKRTTPALHCNRGIKTRPVGSEKITEAAKKRRNSEATLKCPFNGCNATFTTNHNLRYHVNSHVGYKPYHCKKGCPYRASSPSTMKRHETKCVHVQRG